ncbi:MAG: c-type cytochrome [Rhodoferax sp.]|uniref:c-type cytochrome n=1 Tax=Rhodoferax sp. TaxID=50421 RepID=UPI002733DB7B|nr:c-type cytochrome [Rhodoferax sp.]MDP2680242.1 c-type cytochrome [Rhodoferax sp.]
MKNFRQRITLGFAVTAAATLVACGGGGGSTVATGTPAPSLINGLAATGLAIDNGQVSLKCISGQVNPVSTNADGSFTVDVSQVTLPCVARVDFNDSTGAAKKLHSLARTAGTLNITQVTDLVVANLSSTGVADDVFAQFESRHAEVEGYDDDRVRTATERTKTHLESKGISTASLPTDVIATRFRAKHDQEDGDEHDRVLDDIEAKIESEHRSLDDWEQEMHDGDERDLSTTTGQVGDAALGKAAWDASCSSCHGVRESDAKNAAKILEAIRKNEGGMGVLATSVNQSMANNIATYMMYGLSSTPVAALTSQTISFTAPADQTLGVTPAALSASTTSGLPVTISSTTPVVCSVSNNILTLNAAGSCGVTASQAGNTTYSAAPNVSYSFTVASAAGVVLPAQTITFASPGAQAVGTPVTLTATSSSGLAVTFASTTLPVCTVSGNTLTLLSAGTCNVNADQAGDTGFAAAASVSQSFAVTSPVPVTPVASATSGKTLYANCSGCHGVAASGGMNVLAGANSASTIQSAINLNRGGMGMFSNLSTQNIADLAAYLATPTI